MQTSEQKILEKNDSLLWEAIQRALKNSCLSTNEGLDKTAKQIFRYVVTRTHYRRSK